MEGAPPIPRTRDTTLGEPAPAATADGLLETSWERQEAPLGSREGRTELAAAALFVLGCLAFAVLVDSSRPWPGVIGLALTGAYVLAARVEFDYGAGASVPTQLVLVPMLLVLPEVAVPPLVAGGLVLATLLDRRPADRLPGAVADAWHALGPAVVLALAAPGDPSLEHWPVLLAAFGAQAAFDALASALRLRVGAGVAPGTQLRVMGAVVVGDALLLPVGLAAALASTDRRAAVLLVVPLIPLLGLLARDRRRRIEQAQARLAALREERARVRDGLRRFGEALSSRLDQDELLRLVVATAVDAGGGHAGRATIVRNGGVVATAGEPAPHDAVLTDVEHAALGAGTASRVRGNESAMACRVTIGSEVRAVVSVVRWGPAFDDDERAALDELASQGAISLQNADLHRRLREQAVTDALTGLPNHRRFQETLAREAGRARRSDTRIGAVLLDIDDFKAVNDTYGHLVGDHVLREVGARLGRASRAADELARYGGEEFAVVVPDAGPELLGAIAERLRAGVAAEPVELPGGGTISVTVSVGAAVQSGVAFDPVGLLAAADEALYAAKRAGKNRVVLAGGGDAAPAA